MDVSIGLQATLLRQQAEHASRAAESRIEHHRETTGHAPVEYGGALSHLNAPQDAQPVAPTAIADPTRPYEGPPRLVDILT